MKHEENTLGEPEKEEKGAHSYTEAAGSYTDNSKLCPSTRVICFNPKCSTPDTCHKLLKEVEERVEEKGPSDLDFLVWYSGMEAEKIKRAYKIYLRDVVTKKS